MVFESLYEALRRKELILIDGGMCRYRTRIDGQLTILEIISSKPGAGSRMLKMLQEKKSLYILAKCPADLSANDWYKKKGFRLHETETTKSGRKVNVWIL